MIDLTDDVRLYEPGDRVPPLRTPEPEPPLDTTEYVVGIVARPSPGRRTIRDRAVRLEPMSRQVFEQLVASGRLTIRDPQPSRVPGPFEAAATYGTSRPQWPGPSWNTYRGPGSPFWA